MAYDSPDVKFTLITLRCDRCGRVLHARDAQDHALNHALDHISATLGGW